VIERVRGWGDGVERFAVEDVGRDAIGLECLVFGGRGEELEGWMRSRTGPGQGTLRNGKAKFSVAPSAPAVAGRQATAQLIENASDDRYHHKPRDSCCVS